jgi:hypothetical protein
LRTGDRFAADALVMVLFSPLSPAFSRCLAATVRGELGIGGATAAIGLATNALPTDCTRGDFLESGVLGLEARLERTYSPTSWRSTEYVGGQVSLATLWWFKPSLAWMFDVHDAADQHVQVGVGVGF